MHVFQCLNSFGVDPHHDIEETPLPHVSSLLEPLATTEFGPNPTLILLAKSDFSDLA